MFRKAANSLKHAYPHAREGVHRKNVEIIDVCFKI